MSQSTSIDVELLLDRLLSASTPTDCLDSLDQLQKQCRYNRPKPPQQEADPKKQRPSQKSDLDEAQKEAESAEEERQSNAIDTLLGNKAVLHALCSLVSASTLPSQHHDGGSSSSSGMEVEGGDVAACELILAVLPSPTSSSNTTDASKSKGGATTDALQKQRKQKRRMEYISKTLLHFHDADSTKGGFDSGSNDLLALTPSLLDCLCASQSSVYARVLSLQTLQSLLSASPGVLREQLMQAPDGINRLVDLLGHGSTTTSMDGTTAGENYNVPEEVRNEAILFLTCLASSSSMLARLITFSEGYDRALKIALESSGGGLSIGMDCLELCLALAYADDVARELFLGGGDGRGNLDRLAQLVDLRGGERFRDKERNLYWDRELKEKKRGSRRGSSGATGSGKEGEDKSTKQQGSGRGKGGKRGKKSKDDDLDDILRGASTPSMKTTDADKQSNQSQQQSTPIEPQGPPVPYLTPNETNIMTSVFNLILALLLDGEEEDSTPTTNEVSRSKRRGRAKTIMSHDLSRFIVDCALYTLPPPGVDYVSAVPPPKLQQKALVAMAVLGSLGDTIISEDTNSKGTQSDTENDLRKKEKEEESNIQTHLLFETMPIYLHGRVTAIDRLMYLCCTGAYAPKSPMEEEELDDDERSEVLSSLLSTYSISTFQSCLPSETASRMVLHALAPPPPDETDMMGAPLEPPVVTRLVTTLADNLRFLQDQHSAEASELDMTAIYRATIGASGSAGALGVFLSKGEGDATREMLLRLSPPPPPFPPPEKGADPAELTHDKDQSEPTNLIDFVLQHVSSYDPNASDDKASTTANVILRSSAAFVTESLLKLLCEWVIGMPRAVSETLSSPSSVSLGVLVRAKKSVGAVPALSGLLLGLCLENMADSDGAAATPPAGDAPNMENLAWTKETIMNLISSMGVGKYLSMIDEFKKRPLPLPYCQGIERSAMERRAFCRWYGYNVTLVRRRVVVTLAGSRGDGDSDSDTEEQGSGMAADGKSSSSIRSLRKMVSSQAQEVEDLQAKLDEALLTIASQSTQLKELKRVAELGTSADTNDMISEYTEKVAELERVKASLKKEAEAQAKLQTESLVAKDEEIQAVQKELLAAQTSVEDMKRDNENLSEEMSGLSAAYNALEAQYNHRSNNGGDDENHSSSAAAPTEMTAGGETAAEDGGARNFHTSTSVPGGEAAAEDPGRDNNFHEVQSLRDENSRLREDVRAANEWMTMAVSKMEEMGSENENLARSLDEARTNATTGTDSTEVSSALQGELDSLRQEMQAARVQSEAAMLKSEAALKEKDDELAEQKSLVNQLQEANKDLRKATNGDSQTQEGLENEALQKELDQIKAENATLTSNLSEFQAWSETAQSRLAEVETQLQEASNERDELKNTKIVGLETSLLEMTSQRDDLQATEFKLKEEISALQERNGELLKPLDHDSQAHDSPEKEALQKELDQIKTENATLTASLTEFQTWSETAQGRLAEVDAQLQEACKERDELKSQMESTSPEGQKSSSEDANQIETLKREILEKSEQLERMQDQLIEDAEENEAKNEKLLEELDTARQRLDDLIESEKSSSELVEKLSLEKEELSTLIASKESEIDSTRQSKNQADMRAEDALRRISELEALKAAAESQVEKLMAIEDQHEKGNLDEELIAITAERNELQTQLDDINEEYNEMQTSLERTNMENGNLIARNRALEQDNKSLEFQFAELKEEIKQKDDLLTVSEDEKSTMQSALNEMKLFNEDAAQEGQEQIQAMKDQLAQQEKEAAEVISQWEGKCATLEQAGERAQSLEDELAEQQKEAAEAIAQWESRCAALEKDDEGVIQQWSDRVDSLQGEVASLENQLQEQAKEAAEAIAQWESRCAALEKDDEGVIQQWSDRVDSLQAEVSSLENQLAQQEQEAAEAIAQWETRCTGLENDGESVVRQWEEKVKSMENEMASMQEQLAQQEQEAAEVIDQWETRCTGLEDNGESIIQQWEEKVKSLENEMTSMQEQLAQQEQEAAEAIAQWQIRCTGLESEIQGWEEKVKSMDDKIICLENQYEAKVQESADVIAQLELKHSEAENSFSVANAEITAMSEQLQELQGSLVNLKRELEQKTQTIESMQNDLKDKDDDIASSGEQISELANELTETQSQSEQVVKQWQERSEQLESTIAELEETIEDHEKGANEAIEQWELRCTALNDKIESLELQLAQNDMDAVVEDLNSEVSSLKSKLNISEANYERTQENLKEAKDLLALRLSEWEDKEASLVSTIDQMKNSSSEQQAKVDETLSSLDDMKEQCSVLQSENEALHQERNEALKESEESQVIVLELKEELRHAKEELQSYATDQFTVKATEMATQALRQQMVEIRSQYTVDQETLASEREARRVAEDNVVRLKSDLALLAQATEYNEDVDVHVRKIAKKVSAENVRAERREMEELRSTLEHLREELGSCRWKERESEEKATNARLQMSILEQEVSAAKADLALIEQAMEELDNSKIEMSVSLEYRIEALENERLLTSQAYEEEINGVKAELAHANQERDILAHKLEQSEKANAALVYSTAHEDGGVENQSEVIKLQLERAQLLAKINDMGSDLERRVREAVAAQASASEAELIVVKQSRKSVESSLSDALTELDETKTHLAGQTSKSMAGALADKEQAVEDLQETLDDMRMANEELESKNRLLQAELDSSDKENKSTIDDLRNKLQKAEEQLRSEERESRFEAAMASEIANLRASTQPGTNGGNEKNDIVLRGIDQNMRPSTLFEEGKESIDRNSAYIIEMYDYVVELKQSITEERQMYKDLLAEHEDLLALLGQAGLDGMQFSASG